MHKRMISLNLSPMVSKLEKPFCQCFEFCVSVLCLAYPVACWMSRTGSKLLHKKLNSVWPTIFSMWVTCSVQLVALNYGLCIASGTLFVGDKLCRKLVNIYLFHKLTAWYWSTNRYASFEMEKKNFFKLKTENRDTELKTLMEWISGQMVSGIILLCISRANKTRYDLSVRDTTYMFLNDWTLFFFTVFTMNTQKCLKLSQQCFGRVEKLVDLFVSEKNVCTSVNSE